MKQIILAFLLTVTCRADVLFNSITGDISLGSVPVASVPGINTYAAAEFTPSVNSSVVDAKFFLAGVSGTTVEADLFSDQGGLPGSVLALLGFVTFNSTEPDTFTVSPANPIDLVAGTPYWTVLFVAAGAPAVENWYGSSISDPAAAGFSTGGPISWRSNSALQFALDGTTAAAATPEPATFGLLGLGAVVLGIFHYRAKRKVAGV